MRVHPRAAFALCLVAVCLNLSALPAWAQAPQKPPAATDKPESPEAKAKREAEEKAAKDKAAKEKKAKEDRERALTR
ncbi:hypothetical protein MCEMSEM47_00289 [Burkholderiales bacterium]